MKKRFQVGDRLTLNVTQEVSEAFNSITEQMPPFLQHTKQATLARLCIAVLVEKALHSSKQPAMRAKRVTSDAEHQKSPPKKRTKAMKAESLETPVW